MTVCGKLLAGLLFILSLELCYAQHWSYGLRPGGKRESENLIDSFQDAGNEADKPAEVQHFDCTIPQQNSRLSLQRGSLMLNRNYSTEGGGARAVRNLQLDKVSIRKSVTEALPTNISHFTNAMEQCFPNFEEPQPNFRATNCCIHLALMDMRHDGLKEKLVERDFFSTRGKWFLNEVSIKEGEFLISRDLVASTLADVNNSV